MIWFDYFSIMNYGYIFLIVNVIYDFVFYYILLEFNGKDV